MLESASDWGTCGTFKVRVNLCRCIFRLELMSWCLRSEYKWSNLDACSALAWIKALMRQHLKSTRSYLWLSRTLLITHVVSEMMKVCVKSEQSGILSMQMWGSPIISTVAQSVGEALSQTRFPNEMKEADEVNSHKDPCVKGVYLAALFKSCLFYDVWQRFYTLVHMFWSNSVSGLINL